MPQLHFPKPGLGNDFQLRQLPQGWVVINERGVIHSGPHTMRNAAEQARRDLQAAKNAKEKRGNRPCITCGKTFESEGIHNRMCSSCRHQGEAFNGTATVIQRGARRVAKS